MRSFFATIQLWGLVLCLGGVAAASGSDLSLNNAAPGTDAILLTRLGPGFSALTSGHFLVFYENQTAEAQELTEILESANRRFCYLFEQAGFKLRSSDQKLAWIYFNDRNGFNNYASWADKISMSRDSWLDSYYSSKTNRVAIVSHKAERPLDDNTLVLDHSEAGSVMAIVDDGRMDKERIVHELAHQLSFNTGIQKQGVMYPLWASEGLAGMFEKQFNAGGLDCRQERLVNMQTQGRLISLSEFLSITRAPADASGRKDVYAQASGFFSFLLEHRNKALIKYLEGLAKLEPGPRTPGRIRLEFIKAFGPVEKLQADWSKYISSLSAGQMASAQ